MRLNPNVTDSKYFPSQIAYIKKAGALSVLNANYWTIFHFPKSLMIPAIEELGSSLDR